MSLKSLKAQGALVEGVQVVLEARNKLGGFLARFRRDVSIDEKPSAEALAVALPAADKGALALVGDVLGKLEEAHALLDTIADGLPANDLPADRI